MQVISEDITQPTKAKFVQILEDKSEFVCDLPIDRHFNDGTGVIWYVNQGFVPYDEYMSKKHAAEVEAKKQAEAEAEKKKPAKAVEAK